MYDNLATRYCILSIESKKMDGPLKGKKRVMKGGKSEKEDGPSKKKRKSA